VGNWSHTCLVVILLLGPALALAWMLIRRTVVTYLRGSRSPARQQDLVEPQSLYRATPQPSCLRGRCYSAQSSLTSMVMAWLAIP
jgi:hypothetical protein